MTLADCHSRRMLDGDSSVFFCANPRMHAPRSWSRPSSAVCAACGASPLPRPFGLLPPPGRAGHASTGQRAGPRECKRCRGSVRQKTFACGHPLHGEAVLRDCRSCPDYEPLLATGAVKTWAVGLTTAPRQEPTLAGCLTAWPPPVGTRPSYLPNRERSCPERTRSLELVRRAAPLGVIGNWLLGLSELLVRAPAADAYLMVQDDVVFCRNVRGCLERVLGRPMRGPGISVSPRSLRLATGRLGAGGRGPRPDGGPGVCVSAAGRSATGRSGRRWLCCATTTKADGGWTGWWAVGFARRSLRPTTTGRR